MFEEFFHKYPYTNFHEMNLDWVLSAIKEMMSTIETFVSANAIKYADPIAWSITSQYEKNTVVIDSSTGTAYLSVSEVPSGISLSRTEYWTVIFDLSAFISKAAKNFANTFEDFNVTIATQSTAQYGWLVLGDTLYRANTAITPGDAYTVGGNVTKITIEDVIGKIQLLNTTNKTNLVAAINEVLATLNTVAGDLAELDTSDKDNLVDAINEVNNLAALVPEIVEHIGDLAELDTTVTTDLVSAINEVVASVNLAVTTLTGITGDLGDLDTVDKSDLVAAINEIVAITATLGNSIGNLASLQTTAKNNLVAAINELVGSVTAINNSLTAEIAKTGNLANLITVNKSNLVAAINEAAISGGGGGTVIGGGKNILDNGYFQIFQRAFIGIDTLTGTCDNAYHIDRWIFASESGSPAGSWDLNGNTTNNNYVINDAELTISADENVAVSLVQKIDQAETKLSDKAITVTVLSNGEYITGSGTVVFGNNLQVITKTGWNASIDEDGDFVITVEAGHTLSISGVMLELGSVSTMASQMIADPYEELIKCFSYLRIFSSAYFPFVKYSSNVLRSSQFSEYPMRTNPVVTIRWEYSSYFNGTTFKSFPAGTTISTGNYGVRIDIVTPTAISDFSNYVVECGRLIISAEL